MRSTVILRLAAMLVVGLAAGLQLRAESDAKQTNIILCMADDQGWGDTGYNGHRMLRTPHLDKMAAEGVRFNRFYSGAPVCSPTRGSCLTGRHPFRYGIFFANTGHLPEQEPNLAQILKKQGYTTGHFGKWHLGTLTKTIRDSNRGGRDDGKNFAPPWERSFDVCFSTEAKTPTWDPMVKPPKAKGTFWNPLKAGDERQPYGTRYWNEKGEIVEENLDGDDSRIIMDRAIPFIENAVKNGRPFFTVIWFHAPHLPVVSGEPHRKHYVDAKSDYFVNYYGCITALDEQMGRLRSKLDELGVADNTMVWYCSDNGPEGNSSAPGRTNELRGRKRSLHDGGVRVPGLLVWPNRVKQPRVIDTPASTLDYLPTVLDALEIETPTMPIDGVSLLPILRGETDKRAKPIPFESRQQVALVDNRYKLISSDAGKTWMLYDMPADPSEKNDLSAEKPEVTAAMVKQVEQWRRSHRASLAGDDYK